MQIDPGSGVPQIIQVCIKELPTQTNKLTINNSLVKGQPRRRQGKPRRRQGKPLADPVAY